MDTARYELECIESCGSPGDGVFEGEHCSPGVQCIGFACFPAGSTPPGEPCVEVDECTDGYTCSSREELADPTCVQTCVSLHYDDSECPEGSICTQRSVCIPPCDPAAPMPCPQGGGYLCVWGECRSHGGGRQLCPNPENTLCPVGLLCDQVTFECLDPIEFNLRYPRPEGGRCQQEGQCPLYTH